MKVSIASIFLLFIMHFTFAQDDSGFIYGKVITKHGSAYVGQIRWGNEETFWSDLFNSVKTYGKSIHIEINNTDDDNTEKQKEYRWEILKIWDDQYSGQVHQFTCRFGDIKSLAPHPNSEVAITFKNDHKVIVRGGSNDIGARVHVYDYEIGEIEVSWGDISEIIFFDTPRKIEKKPGNPIFGTVETNSGKFTGLIAWDNDERIDTDKIDGEFNQNSVHLPFKEITCLEKSGCGTLLQLGNGTQMMLTGTNDVDCSNRGIYITNGEVGIIEVPWNQFKKLCLNQDNKYSGQPYRSYGTPKRLSGTVKVINKGSVKGTIVFDKDEIWDFELLEGASEGIKYTIPFRYIKKISPKNYDFAEITLRSGQNLILGNSQDVSSQNEGIIVIKNENTEPVIVNWMDIDEIIFD